METIKLSFKDFRVIPDFNSVHREAIDDEVYFSSKYAKWLSNSRLRWINPLEGGNPQLFYAPPKLKLSALSLGSVIHNEILTPDAAFVGGKIGKPSSKLGLVMDEIDHLLHSKKEFYSFDDLIKEAALRVDYYSSIVDSKISFIKQAWNEYSPKLEAIRQEAGGKPVFTLSDRDWDVAQACVKSLKENTNVMSKLHPTDAFGDPIESYFEDALFMDYIVTYQGKQCSILRFKLKIDNWTIDYDNKVVTVNDLKTTGHGVNHFVEEGGSLYNFHYFRQLAIYSSILWTYLTKTKGVTKDTGWTLKSNILAVETIPNYWSRCFSINDGLLKMGMKEANELLKRVAACEIFGYDKEFIFE